MKGALYITVYFSDIFSRQQLKIYHLFRNKLCHLPSYQATVKLPSKADLSNCHLEFIPETVFVNIELQILILRHNALRERPFDEDIYTIGWLDDLPRFTFLRSLNLADNQLMTFPLSLCNVRSLMELNLASNKLEEIPPQICELVKYVLSTLFFCVYLYNK